jgi:hypothetical protein
MSAIHCLAQYPYIVELVIADYKLDVEVSRRISDVEPFLFAFKQNFERLSAST